MASSLIYLIIWLIILGIAWWGVTKYIPLPAPLPIVVNILFLLLVLVLLLDFIGVIHVPIRAR